MVDGGKARTILSNLTDEEVERVVVSLQAKRDSGQEITSTVAYGLWLFTQERAERKAINETLREAGLEAHA